MKVAVLKGGRSLERGGLAALRRAGRGRAGAARPRGRLRSTSAPTWSQRLRAERPDVAFVALHGPGGEDGTAQELLEILGIPYTGPGVAACARCIDKVARQARAARGRASRPPTGSPSTQTAFRELGAADALGEIEERLGFPLVVKPAAAGSALGVKFAADRERGARRRCVAAFSYDDRVLLERFVDGRELAVSVLGGEPLPIVEAIPDEGDRYDFEARYEIGRTALRLPGRARARTRRDAVTEAALGAYEALGCAGFSRVDLMLGDDGPAGARGQRDPRPHRHQPAAAGRRGGRDRASSSWSSGSSSWRSSARRVV